MTYREQYNQIINFRKQNPLSDTEYGEVHHIIPKSVGGSNESDNLIKLTAAEHYKVHCLLPFVYKEEGNKSGYEKMLYAWNIIAHCPQKFHQKDLSFVDKDAEVYEQLKTSISQYMKNYNPAHREEVRQKIVENHSDCRGANNPMFGKHHSEETRRRMSESRKRYFENCSDAREKLSRNNGAKSKEAREKCGNASRGMLFWTNGIIVVRAKECPGPDYKRGLKVKQQ